MTITTKRTLLYGLLLAVMSEFCFVMQLKVQTFLCIDWVEFLSHECFRGCTLCCIFSKDCFFASAFVSLCVSSRIMPAREMVMIVRQLARFPFWAIFPAYLYLSLQANVLSTSKLAQLHSINALQKCNAAFSKLPTCKCLSKGLFLSVQFLEKLYGTAKNCMALLVLPGDPRTVWLPEPLTLFMIMYLQVLSQAYFLGWENCE